MKALLVEIRREFWEHRALWMAPLAIAVALLLAAAAFGHARLEINDRPVLQNGESPPQLYQYVLFGSALPLFLAAAILASAYLLDCLYAERRDRSILFWRSMPVSDARAVLVKLAVGLLIVPLGTYALAALTSVVVSAILVVRNHGLLIGGASALTWNVLPWLQLQGELLYGLIAALLWYAPFAAYLLLVSVWARRSPYAWAFIPPVLLVIFERLEFGTHYVGQILDRSLTELLHLAFRFDAPAFSASAGTGAAPDAAVNVQFSGGADLPALTPLHLLADPRLLCGLLAAVLMTSAAIWLRRSRDEA
jgi:ABC-2 type transport system permease protein